MPSFNIMSVKADKCPCCMCNVWSVLGSWCTNCSITLKCSSENLPQQLTTCEGHYVIGLIAKRDKVQSITVCWSGFNGCFIVPATFFFTFILGASSAKLLSIMASISVISQVKSFSWPGGQMMCWEARQSGGHESHEGMLHWMGKAWSSLIGEYLVWML